MFWFMGISVAGVLVLACLPLMSRVMTWKDRVTSSLLMLCLFGTLFTIFNWLAIGLEAQYNQQWLDTTYAQAAHPPKVADRWWVGYHQDHVVHKPNVKEVIIMAGGGEQIVRGTSVPVPMILPSMSGTGWVSYPPAPPVLPPCKHRTFWDWVKHAPKQENCQ